MTKLDLIVALAGKENLTEKQAKEIINQIINGFKDSLTKGDRIEIRGFGSFTVREYKAYKGRNPRAGINVGKELKGFVFSNKIGS